MNNMQCVAAVVISVMSVFFSSIAVFAFDSPGAAPSQNGNAIDGIKWGAPRVIVLKNTNFELNIEKNGCIKGIRVGNLLNAFNEIAIYANGAKNRAWCVSESESCIPQGSAFVEREDSKVAFFKGRLIMKDKMALDYLETISISGSHLRINYIIESNCDLKDIDVCLALIMPYNSYTDGSFTAEGSQPQAFKSKSSFNTAPALVTLNDGKGNQWSVSCPKGLFNRCEVNADNKDVYFKYNYVFDVLRGAAQKKSFDIYIHPDGACSGPICDLSSKTAIAKSARYSCNILPGDNSFETGLSGWGLKGNAWKKYNKENRDSVDGKSCLRILGSLCKDNIGLTANERVSLKENTIYTLSAYLKGVQPDSMVSMKVFGMGFNGSSNIKLSNSWQRFSLTFKTGKTTYSWCVPSFSPIGETNEFLIDAIQLEEGGCASEYQASEPLSIGIEGISAPGNTYCIGERGIEPVELIIRNNSSIAKDIRLSYGVRNHSGKESPSTAKSILLHAFQSHVEKLDLQVNENGFFTIFCRALDSIGNVCQARAVSFCVVPKSEQATFGSEFMGICFIKTTEPERLKKIGVQAILTHPTWAEIEKKEGEFNWAVFDREMQAYRKNGFEIIGTFTPFPPKWASELLKKREFDKYENCIRIYMNKLVDRYKSDIHAWDFWSEADLSIQNNIYGATPQERKDNYVRFVKAGYKGAKDADPDCVFATCGVSGADGGNVFSPNSFPFARAILPNLTGCIDIFPLHPYTFPREFAPGLSPISPEASGLDKKIQLAKDIMLQSGECKRLWIGELGWCLDREVSVGDRYAKDFADYLARSYIIAKAAPGVEKYIWYTDEDWLSGRNSDYGLWRWNGNPTPAVSAYAATSHMLSGTKQEKTGNELSLGSNIKGYFFLKGSGFVAAFWVPSPRNASIDIPVNGTQVSVLDVMGAPTSYLSDKHKSISLTLDTSPKWVIADTMSVFPFNGWPNKTDGEMLSQLSNEIKVHQAPLSLDIAFKSDNALDVIARNDANISLSGVVNINMYPQPPGRELVISYDNLRPGEIRQLQALSPGDDFHLQLLTNVEMTAKSATGISTLNIKPEFMTVPRAKRKITVDGNLNEWHDVLPIKLDQAAQVSPPDATAHKAWGGAKDLSASIYMAYDESNFYFAAKVTDDTHNNPYVGRMACHGDSIQIAFDAGNDASLLNRIPPCDLKGYREYGFALTVNGPQTYCYAKLDDVMKYPVAIKRDGDTTCYEAVIPMAELNLQRGNVFGFDVCVFDKDEDGAMLYWMELSPGLAGGKEPALFKKFILEK